MVNINRVYATLRLIRHTLMPTSWQCCCVPPPSSSGLITVPPDAFAATVRQLDKYLRPDGTLELLFEAVLAPAAPFLLYHLKRNGFSGCRVVAVAEGILLTARR